MSQSLVSVFTTALVVGLTGWAAGSLAALSREAARAAEARRAEWSVRRCAAELAYEQNLAAASRVLAGLNPEHARRLAYEPPPLEACMHPGSEASAVVVRERNPRHPPDWPNWVPRFRAARVD